MRGIPEAAIALIVRFEGFSASPYICPAGVPTIGFGSTRYESRKRVTMQDPPISRTRARGILTFHCRRVARIVDRLVRVELREHERAALISFAYNVGTGALAASTLRAKLNRGDRIGAAGEFRRWRFSGGRPLKGLARRRRASRELFMTHA